MALPVDQAAATVKATALHQWRNFAKNPLTMPLSVASILEAESSYFAENYGNHMLDIGFEALE